MVPIWVQSGAKPRSPAGLFRPSVRTARGRPLTDETPDSVWCQLHVWICGKHGRLYAHFLRAGSGGLRLAPMPAHGGQAILAVIRWPASWRLLTQSPQPWATRTTSGGPLFVNPDSVVAGHR